MNRAVYAGSFDPCTRGHLDIVERALELFDYVEIVVGQHPSKQYLFTQQQRVDFIRANLASYGDRVKVSALNGQLLADYAYEHGFKTIIKGVRNAADFDYERVSHDVSFSQQKGLETVLLVSRQALSHVSSSAAKEVCRYHGVLRDYVPFNVKYALERTVNNEKIIGVTGVIASGKSFLVEKLFASRFAVRHIDMDRIAHDILFTRQEEIYLALREQIKKAFYLVEITRKDLGEIVFSNPANLAELNRLMREPILMRVRAEIRDGKNDSLGRRDPFLHETIILNGALLVEAGFLHLCNNNVVLIDASDEVRYKRLIARGLNGAQIERRLASQLTTAQKINKIEEEIKKERFGKLVTVNNSKGAEFVSGWKMFWDTILEQF